MAVKKTPAVKAAKAAPASAMAAAPASAMAAAPVATAAVERSEVKGSGTAKAPAAVAVPKAVSQEDIAKRAFEIYAGRGYAPGDQHADWLEAERQLRAGL